MSVNDFYQQLVTISELSPLKRRNALLELHRRVYDEYIQALRQITPAGASLIVPGDWTVAQVVGHILEWDRAIMMAFGEILSGLQWPRIMSRPTNVENDGSIRDFTDTDDFNAYYAEIYAQREWDVVLTQAEDIATTILRLFETPTLLTVDRLERTKEYDRYRLPIGVTLSMPCGWYLWMVTLEHEGIEHAEDLRIGSSA